MDSSGAKTYLDTNFINLGRNTHILWLLPHFISIYPLFTPIYPNLGYQYQEDLRGLLIRLSMFYQEHMLKFSACYEFVPGLYVF